MVRLSEQLFSKIWAKFSVARLSDPNVVTSGFACLEFACSTLERTGAKQFWATTMAARLSDGMFA